MNIDDWVYDEGQRRVAKVKEIHDDGSVDLVFYARSGERIGRESPAMGGPRNFEPCCGPESWKLIDKPAFPMRPWESPRFL